MQYNSLPPPHSVPCLSLAHPVLNPVSPTTYSSNASVARGDTKSRKSVTQYNTLENYLLKNVAANGWRVSRRRGRVLCLFMTAKAAPAAK